MNFVKLIKQTSMNTRKETYRVEGMTCSGCERAVQRSVSALEGVTSASANASASTMTVEFDPLKVNVDQVKDAVSKLGYKFAGEHTAGDRGA